MLPHILMMPPLKDVFLSTTALSEFFSSIFATESIHEVFQEPLSPTNAKILLRLFRELSPFFHVSEFFIEFAKKSGIYTAENRFFLSLCSFNI